MEFSAGPGPSRLWALLLLVVPTLGCLVGSYVLCAQPTLSYHLTADTLRVDAKLGFVDLGRSVPRADISGAHAVKLGHGTRTNGTAVEGFCQGTWSLPDLGTVWVATHCSGSGVFVEARDRNLVLSPPDEAAFVAAVVDPTATGDWVVAVPPRSPLLYGGAALLLLLPLVIFGSMTRVLRTFRYRVEGGELVVPRHFGELRVPLNGTPVRGGDLGFAMRVAGSGLPGFYLGAFRSRDEGGFHVAATRRHGGLYVDGPRKVYVTPEDRDGFLTALVSAGALLAPSARGASSAKS